MCCWIGGNWMHLSTGVIGPDRRYVMAIGSLQPTDDATARDTITQAVKTMFPGGRIYVAAGRAGAPGCAAAPCSRRHAAILAWSPDSSTSGTSSPRQLGGRV